jgi:hypothetical protein
VIYEYHNLSDRINKGCESSVCDFRNDVDTYVPTTLSVGLLTPLKKVTWLHNSGVIDSNPCLLLSAPVTRSTKCPIKQGHILAFSV